MDRKIELHGRYRWFIFAVLSAIFCFVTFHRAAVAVISEELMNSLRIGPKELGVLGAALLYAYSIMQIPSGMFADRFGPRNVMAISFLGAGIGSIVFGCSSNYQMALFSRVVIGLGLSCIYISSLKILGGWFRQQEFATVLGLMMALGVVGTIAASAPLAFMVTRVGWQLTFILAGGLSLVLVLIMWVVVREAQSTGSTASGAADPAREDPDRGSHSTRDGAGLSWRMLLSSRDYWLLVANQFTSSAFLAFRSVWVGPFLHGVYDLSITEIGEALLFLSIGGILSSPLYGFFSDRVLHSRKWVFLAGQMISLGLWSVMTFYPAAIPANGVKYYFFVAGVSGMGFILVHALVRESFPSQITGVAIGIINFFTFFGSAVFTQVMGLLVEGFRTSSGSYPATAYQATLVLAFVLLVLSCLVVIPVAEAGTDGSAMK